MNIPTSGTGSDTELCRTVLEYSRIMKRLVDRAKQPGFTVADWAPLAELVAVDEFERVGPFRELMHWRQYVGFLTQWACSAGWESTFRRVHQWANVVFLELEERSHLDGKVDVVNSLSVYEFNAAGKIRHLDIYLQRDYGIEARHPELLRR
jgi:hypothetical protein